MNFWSKYPELEKMQDIADKFFRLYGDALISQKDLFLFVDEDIMNKLI